MDLVAGHVYKGIEFVMDQRFILTYEYGQVCYNKSSRSYHWPGLNVTPEECTPSVISPGVKTLTLPVTITQSTHHIDR